MTFQASDWKGKHFLELLNDDNNIIKTSYIKGRLWLKHLGHSNSLCTRAMRAITNHTLISKYRLMFFLREDFSYLYGLYSIETQKHILHKYRRFNRYENLRRDSLSHFILFLEFNPNVFAFANPIT